MQLILFKEGINLWRIFHEGHDRGNWKGSHISTGTQLHVHDDAVRRSAHDRLLEIVLCVFELFLKIEQIGLCLLKIETISSTSSNQLLILGDSQGC